MSDPAGYCSYCGTAPSSLTEPVAASAGVPFVPMTGLGVPGIGVAGFVLSLLGFSVLGLILSWIGLSQAKREGRPTGLCLAGVIIGVIGLIVTVVLIIVYIAALNALSSNAYYE